MASESDLSDWHTIHPYFAKFSPIVPERFIREWTTTGDLILDPFCGSGTTGVVCTLEGRDFLGVDANPIATLMTRVKTSNLDSESLDYCRDIISNRESVKSIKCHELPNIPNMEKWFTEEMALELSKLKGLVVSSPPAVRDFISLAFSRIIVKCSNQHGESRYVSVNKEHRPGKAYDMFFDTLSNMLSNYSSYASYRAESNIEIICEDLRSVDLSDCRGKVSLAVTSPPYLNSWDYSLYHRFRYFWLDLPIKPFADVEIGQHLRGQRKKGNEMVEEYRSDMSQCLRNVFHTLLPGARFVILNAPAIVNKKRVDSSQIIIDEAVNIGYSLESLEDDEMYGPHHGNRASLETKGVEVEGDKKKREQTIILRKPS